MGVYWRLIVIRMQYVEQLIIIHIDWTEALEKNIDLDIEDLRMCDDGSLLEKTYHITKLFYINDK